MENFKSVAETTSMNREQLEESKASLQSLYDSFSKDPMMANDARDLEKMITNIENRILGLQN